jgi:hypothetical protein
MDDFNVLPGLPTSGPMHLSFSETEQGKHREGFVVEFHPADGETWVGNFARDGFTDFSTAVLHPNGRFVVVVSSGQAYVVDPQRRSVLEMFGGQFQSLFAVADLGLLVFQTPFDFLAINAKRRAWKTHRMAIEEFRSVRVEGARLVGEACDLGDLWVPFEIDLASGKVKGGSPAFKRRWWQWWIPG